MNALSSFPGVPGRMERIEQGQPFPVFVDIASTGAALENVLNALRPATAGKLWVVFGAAGGRDPARRNWPGRSRRAPGRPRVLTNEDPRHEDPDAIIEAIAAGLRRVPGLRVKISSAGLTVARPSLRIRARGSGRHRAPRRQGTETTMIFADGPIPWDERATAREPSAE